jgi:hypothetical protein
MKVNGAAPGPVSFDSINLSDKPARNFATTGTRLLTRREAMDRLRLKSSHFSKVVHGKVKGLPALPVVQIGRCQFFRLESIERWILEVENTQCSAVH